MTALVVAYSLFAAATLCWFAGAVEHDRGEDDTFVTGILLTAALIAGGFALSSVDTLVTERRTPVYIPVVIRVPVTAEAP